jgi:hypothetical protein
MTKRETGSRREWRAGFKRGAAILATKQKGRDGYEHER